MHNICLIFFFKSRPLLVSPTGWTMAYVCVIHLIIIYLIYITYTLDDDDDEFQFVSHAVTRRRVCEYNNIIKANFPYSHTHTHTHILSAISPRPTTISALQRCREYLYTSAHAHRIRRVCVYGVYFTVSYCEITFKYVIIFRIHPVHLSAAGGEFWWCAT